MNYEIILSKKAKKSLDKLQTRDYILVLKHLQSLEYESHPAGSEKLKGFDKLYRIRAGNFRIIYEPHESEIQILVLDIDNRKDIYR